MKSHITGIYHILLLILRLYEVTWLEELIEVKEVVPFAIVVGSLGGLIVQNIWKYVWRGPTVIFNGMTAVAMSQNPNDFIRDTTIKPIFVLLKQDYMYARASQVLKIDSKDGWEFYGTTIYEYDGSDLIPSTILMSDDNATSDLVQIFLKLPLTVPGIFSNSHYEEYRSSVMGMNKYLKPTPASITESDRNSDLNRNVSTATQNLIPYKLHKTLKNLGRKRKVAATEDAGRSLGNKRRKRWEY